MYGTAFCAVPYTQKLGSKTQASNTMFKTLPGQGAGMGILRWSAWAPLIDRALKAV
jgi:hypothetical protein